MGHLTTILAILVILIVFVDFGHASFILLPKIEVGIYNDIHINKTTPLIVHCASKDDDLGNFTLHPKHENHWVFRPSIWGTTRFSCEFLWGRKHRAFRVFNDHWRDRCNAPDVHDRNLCFWVVRSDGFYFSNTRIDPDLEKKFTWLVS